MAKRVESERKRRIDDGFLKSLVDIIKEKHGDYQFTVSQLAKAVEPCESHLEEKLRIVCGTSPQKLIEAFRVGKALNGMSSGRNSTQLSRRILRALWQKENFPGAIPNLPRNSSKKLQQASESFVWQPLPPYATCAMTFATEMR